MFEETKNQLLLRMVDECLDSYGPTDNPTPKEIEAQILQTQSKEIELRNFEPVTDANGDPILDRMGNPKLKKRQDAWRIPETLLPVQIAHIMSKRHKIVRMTPNMTNANPDFDFLAMYMEEGENKGIYAIYESEMRIIARQYNPQLKEKEFEEIRQILLDISEKKQENTDPDLIAVNNGIFDYKTKLLNEFNSDYVFLSKSRTNYIDSPTKPNIVMPDGEIFDVDEWVASLSDDPEIVNLIWELLGAIVRPHVNWGKCAWLYSEVGNNGKGTLCELMRNLCGHDSYVSLPLDKFSDDAMLEPLLNARAIITDENNVGTFIDQAANLKAIITQDVISINRKYKTAITFRFNGMMIQCVNEYPRMRDKSNSMHRRLLIIPFEKSFEGIERRYIKHDYLKRSEVLEYVLYKVLNSDFYELSLPKVCEQALNEYKEYNDPIRQFWYEIREQLMWDFVPFQYLYDLYLEWRKRNTPEGKPQNRGRFIDQLLFLIDEGDDIWYHEGKVKQTRPADRMSGPQPLTIEYDLKDWMNQSTKSSDPNKQSEIDPRKIKTNYRGIRRIGAN